MRFTAQEEYGLRCLVQLAKRPDAGLTIPELAERESLSTAYVGKLLRVLRRTGLVRSTRGQAGGYHLARAANQITVQEVIRALDGTLYSEDFCRRYRGIGERCVHSSDCSIRALWAALDSVVEDLLSQCHLSDLLCSECALEKWVKDRGTGLEATESN